MLSEVLDRTEMDVMREALPVLSEKISHVFIIGMAGVGMAETAVSIQAAVFSSLIFLDSGHGKIKKPRSEPRSSHFQEKGKATAASAFSANAALITAFGRAMAIPPQVA
jgi:hypothetical protein